MRTKADLRETCGPVILGLRSKMERSISSLPALTMHITKWNLRSGVPE